MNRVIRNATLESAPEAYGRAAPLLIDHHMSEVLELTRAEGFDAGRREGYAAGRADMAGAAERIEKALREATTELGRMRAAAVSEAIDAALEIAEFVLGTVPYHDDGALAARIKDALRALDDEDLTVAIHPQDWDTVSSSIRLPVGVSLERDPSLRPGEARIVGRWATAELTREAALSVAREVLS